MVDFTEEYNKELIDKGEKYAIRMALPVFKQLQGPTFKGFAIDNEYAFSMYNYKKEPKDRLYFHQLEQKIISYNTHVGFQTSHDFLYSTFDWKIKRLVEGGFFAHWIDRFINDPSVQAPEPEDDKVVLTMDHLSVGFTIWFGVLVIASVAFIAEFVRVHLAKSLQGIIYQMILRKHQRLQRNH